jgi:hypothetical protein
MFHDAISVFITILEIIIQANDMNLKSSGTCTCQSLLGNHLEVEAILDYSWFSMLLENYNHKDLEWTWLRIFWRVHYYQQLIGLVVTKATFYHKKIMTDNIFRIIVLVTHQQHTHKYNLKKAQHHFLLDSVCHVINISNKPN